MKQLLIIVSLIVSINQLNAQWNQVNTSTNENLYDIFFIDSLEGYCVGGTNYTGTISSTGIILKTTDGGENWTPIFSMDSINIQNIVVVQENNSTKLYAFAVKNGSPYLINTFLHTTFQNWSFTPINYEPKLQVKVYNNDIYFVDWADDNLKRFSNNVITTIDSSVTLFDVSNNGIICLDINNYQIRISPNYGTTWDTLPSYPPLFTTSRLSNASIKKVNNHIILKATYPGAVIYSNDNGVNWTTNNNDVSSECQIMDNGEMIGIATFRKIVYSNDLGANWIVMDTLQAGFYGVQKIQIFNEKFAFIIGDNGIMYKTTNLTTTTKKIDVKKNIEVYPNPVKDFLQIKIPRNIEINSIQLIDFKGNIIKNISINQEQINISSIASGYYFLILQTSEGLIIKKIIIQ